MTDIKYREIVEYMIEGTTLVNRWPAKAKSQINYLMKNYKSATMKKNGTRYGLA